MRTLPLVLTLALAACRTAAPPTPAPPPRAPLVLTYLGVAGWQLESGGHTILIDPYLSRPALDGPMVSDPAAIAAHVPAKVDAILIGHSHVDHLLDAPTIARTTGATLIGSATTTAIARGGGVADAQLVTVAGGEDYQFDGFSVRVLPSLHSALDDKHDLDHLLGGSLREPPTLPMRWSDYPEGGTLAYLIRLGGHEVVVLSSANFIERELEGLRPDVAIVATGLRQEVYDYTCRLMTALSAPSRVYTNHFDDWRTAPVDEPPGEDLQAFVAEVRACAPSTEVTIPRHFAPMTVP